MLFFDDLFDGFVIGGQVEQLEEDASFSYNRVDEVRVAIELILYHVVEYLEQEEDEVVVVRVGEKKSRSREGVEEMQQFSARYHTK